MTPVELLKQELRVYEKALKLSKEKFTEGKILNLRYWNINLQ
jgi:hypothetical protein